MVSRLLDILFGRPLANSEGVSLPVGPASDQARGSPPAKHEK